MGHMLSTKLTTKKNTKKKHRKQLNLTIHLHNSYSYKTCSYDSVQLWHTTWLSQKSPLSSSRHLSDH